MPQPPSTPVRPSLVELFDLSSSPGSEPACCSPSNPLGSRPTTGGGAFEPLSSPASSTASSPMAFKVIDFPPSNAPAPNRPALRTRKPRRSSTSSRPSAPSLLAPAAATSPVGERSNRTQVPHAFTVSMAVKSADFSFICTSCEPEPRFFASNGARKVHQRIQHMQICYVHLPHNKTYEVTRENGVFACPLCDRTNLSTDFLKQHTSRSLTCRGNQLAALPSLPANWKLLPDGVVLGRKPARKVKPELAPIQTALAAPLASPAPSEDDSRPRTRSGRAIKPPVRFGGALSQGSSSPFSSLDATTSDLSPSPFETPVSPLAASILRTPIGMASSTGTGAAFADYFPSVAAALEAPGRDDKRSEGEGPRQLRLRKVQYAAPATKPTLLRKRSVKRPAGQAPSAKKAKARPSGELQQVKVEPVTDFPITGWLPPDLAGSKSSTELDRTAAYPPTTACSSINGPSTRSAPPPGTLTWPVYPPPKPAPSSAHRSPNPTFGQPAHNLSVPPPQTYRSAPGPISATHLVSAPFPPSAWIPTSSFTETAPLAHFEVAGVADHPPFAPSSAAFYMGAFDWSISDPMSRSRLGSIEDEWREPTTSHLWHPDVFAP